MNFIGGRAVAIGTDVYLLGSKYTNYQKYIYKYDTLTDKFTKLPDIPYNFYNGSAVAIGTFIYLLGSAYTNYEKYTYKYNTSMYQNNYVTFIVDSSLLLYKVQITKMLSIYFSKAFIYKDDKIQEYPCYYGDGTKWNLIE